MCLARRQISSRPACAQGLIVIDSPREVFPTFKVEEIAERQRGKTNKERSWASGVQILAQTPSNFSSRKSNSKVSQL